MSGLCSVDGCGREVSAKGYCFKHYVRLRRTGTLETKKYTGDFWSKVARGDPAECWQWLGYKKPSGHGLTTYKGAPIHASRKAWILTHGEIRHGLCVNHRCDNAACCNPDHMYLGTRADNMYDHFGEIPGPLRGAGARKAALSDQELELVWAMRKKGATMRECADATGVHFSTIARYITAIRREKARLLAKVRLSGAKSSRA